MVTRVRVLDKGSGTPANQPLIEAEGGGAHDFSFFNLVELHVLAALRREHGVHMVSIRRAIDYLKKQLNSPRPLINEEMVTDGTDIFVSRLGSLINASKHGQLAMKTLIQEYLKRVDRDDHGLAVRLFPLTRPQTSPRDSAIMVQPRIIAIDPAVAFGRPVIAGSRVPTSEIFERLIAGESPEDLASDFGPTVDERARLNDSGSSQSPAMPAACMSPFAATMTSAATRAHCWPPSTAARLPTWQSICDRTAAVISRSRVSS
ncbi:MAG: DUF433 domain-containing protein [Cyanobacteria bacterium]|nr:DUF433 domain-containing protein [Cyanobacteriota bacterium]